MASRTSSAFAAAVRATLASTLLAAALHAQGRSGTLAGRVTASGEPVAGAAVLVAGTGRGAQTRADGSYRITVPAGRYEVRTRLIGYSSGRDSATVTADRTTTSSVPSPRASADTSTEGRETAKSRVPETRASTVTPPRSWRRRYAMAG